MRNLSWVRKMITSSHKPTSSLGAHHLRFLEGYKGESLVILRCILLLNRVAIHLETDINRGIYY